MPVQKDFAILTSLVCGQQVDFQDIHTEGITKITATDIKYAKALGRSIKLLASSYKTGDSYCALVAPFMLAPEHPLYNVNDVFNAVFVHGNVLGDAMFTEVEQANFRPQVLLWVILLRLQDIWMKIFRWNGVRKKLELAGLQTVEKQIFCPYYSRESCY